MKGVVAALLVALVAVAADECPSDFTQDHLFSHDDCNKFYMCTFGQPVEMTCWGDLFFNVDTWECDWPEKIDCGDRNIPGQEPTTVEPETELTTTEPETEPTTAEPETEPTTAEPETEPTTLEPETEPTTAEPETEPTTAESETEPTPVEPETEPTTAEPETEPTTAEPETDPTTAEPETEPTTAEPETEPTTAEPETDPTTSEPETEPTTAEPTTEEPTTAEPTTAEPTTTPEPTTEEPSTPEFLENGCPVDPHVHWLLPVEGDCNGFYYCVWGELVLRACPATLHFNRVLQVCDWPDNAGCTTSVNKHTISQYSHRFY